MNHHFIVGTKTYISSLSQLFCLLILSADYVQATQQVGSFTLHCPDRIVLTSSKEDQINSEVLTSTSDYPLYRTLIKKGIIHVEHSFAGLTPNIYYLSQGTITRSGQHQIIMKCEYNTRFFYDKSVTSASLLINVAPSRMIPRHYVDGLESSALERQPITCGLEGEPKCHLLPGFVSVVTGEGLKLSTPGSVEHLWSIDFLQFSPENYVVHSHKETSSLSAICPELNAPEKPTIFLINLDWIEKTQQLKCDLFSQDTAAPWNYPYSLWQKRLIWNHWLWENLPNPKLWIKHFKEFVESIKGRIKSEL